MATKFVFKRQLKWMGFNKGSCFHICRFNDRVSYCGTFLHGKVETVTFTQDVCKRCERVVQSDLNALAKIGYRAMEF